MANRRQVIGAGLALSALPLLGGSLPAGERLVATPIRVGRLLVDARFADAAQMAVQATGEGRQATAMPRDVLGLWHDELLPAFRDGRLAALGGITTDTGFFLMRTLAADQYLRVLYQAGHAPAEGGVVRHRLSGNASTLTVLAGGPALQDWRLRFGQAFGACQPAGQTVQRTVLTASACEDLRREALVSWVIAALPSAGAAGRSSVIRAL